MMTIEPQKPDKNDRPVAVDIISDKIFIALGDGRVVTTPLTLYPWLANASPEQQANFELGIFSIDWPDLDEGIDIDWLLGDFDSRQIKLRIV